MPAATYKGGPHGPARHSPLSSQSPKYKWGSLAMSMYVSVP